MADPRFFTTPEPVPVSEISASLGAEIVQGDGDALVKNVGPVARLEEGVLGYLLSRRNLPDTPPTGGVVICKSALAELLADWPVVVLAHEDPLRMYARFAQGFILPRKPVDTAVPVAASAKIGRNTSIAWNATISEDAVIGDNVRIGPGASIGPGVSIGEGCHIGGGVQIRFAELGERVRILPNAVIGGKGFGLVLGEAGAEDIPQLGSVKIGDDVTIGACTTIDRATFDVTVIGDRCKIDNHVHIAHNVVMGTDCVMAAQVGISGSCRIGNNVIMGGKVGLTEHTSIGDGAMVLASAAVVNDIPAGEHWAGIPAKPRMQAFRELYTVEKLAGTGKFKKKK